MAAPRIEVRLQLPDGLSFVERVGFRYCVDKALRASAAAVYWRTIDTINEQRLWMADRLEELHQEQPELLLPSVRARLRRQSCTAARAGGVPALLAAGRARPLRPVAAASTRKFQPLHRESLRLSLAGRAVHAHGVRRLVRAPRWARARGRQPKRYCVEKDRADPPDASRCRCSTAGAAGQRAVFDLAVNDLHAFVAGTVCVHNCIGNSGPLKTEISDADQGGRRSSRAAVLSGQPQLRRPCPP